MIVIKNKEIQREDFVKKNLRDKGIGWKMAESTELTMNLTNM